MLSGFLRQQSEVLRVSYSFDRRPNAGMERERNFGVYLFANPAFRCSPLSYSATRYWFGKIETLFEAQE